MKIHFDCLFPAIEAGQILGATSTTNNTMTIARDYTTDILQNHNMTTLVISTIAIDKSVAMTTKAGLDKTAAVTQEQTTTKPGDNTSVSAIQDQMTTNIGVDQSITVIQDQTITNIDVVISTDTIQEKLTNENEMDKHAMTTIVASSSMLKEHWELPIGFLDTMHMQLQTSLHTYNKTDHQESNSTVPDLKDGLPLASILRHSVPPDIDDDKSAWVKAPVEAESAEVVGSWFALLIAGEIAFILALDINVCRQQCRKKRKMCLRR